MIKKRKSAVAHPEKKDIDDEKKNDDSFSESEQELLNLIAEIFLAYIDRKNNFKP